MNIVPKSPASRDWRDFWGNSWEQVVDISVCEIVNQEQDGQGFVYDPDEFPPLAVKQAVQQIESARGRKLLFPPRPKGRCLATITTNHVEDKPS